MRYQDFETCVTLMTGKSIHEVLGERSFRYARPDTEMHDIIFSPMELTKILQAAHYFGMNNGGITAYKELKSYCAHEIELMSQKENQ